ncbi:MAG: O-antigen ligase family protein [Elusimicrobia bacterium]|nr:O-antigen ligase family protein [Elusimicrobiota bacterium]
MLKPAYILFILGIFILSIAAGKFSSSTDFLISLIAIAGIIFTMISFRRPEHGLIILIFAMLLSPEIILARFPGRAVVVRLDDYLLFILFITWLAYMSVKRETGVFQKTPLNFPITVYIIICIVFTGRAMVLGFVNPAKSSFYVIKYIEYFALYAMVVNIVKDHRFLKQILISALVTYLIVNVYAYVLVAKGVPRIYAPFDYDVAFKSGESAALGGYLLVIMPVILALFCYGPSTKFSYTMLGFFLFSLIPFAYTLSRASFLAFVPMYLVIIALATKRRLPLILMILVGLIFAPIFFPKTTKDVTNRITETFQGADMESKSVVGVRIKETSALLRLQNWNKALTDWAVKQPFFGFGITGVGLVDAQYPLIIGELGFIGLGVFLWLLYSVLVNAIRIYNSMDYWLAKALALGLIAAEVALLFQSIAVNTFITVRIAEPFWLLVAIVMVLPGLYPSKKVPKASLVGI